MIKVLILYPFYNHAQLIDSLCNNLAKAEILADSFDVITWRYTRKSNISRPFLLWFLTPFMIIPKVRGFLITLFRKRILLRISENYDIVDIHFYTTMFDEIITELTERDKAVKITIWGSDFYRASIERKEVQRKFYQKVEVIQMASQQISDDFSRVYPEHKNKVRLAHFGITLFDNIDELLERGNAGIYKVDLKIPPDKIILACGTNGNEAQQHKLLIRSISDLSVTLKEKLFLVIPMTYGGDKKYIEEVRENLIKSGLPYKLLSSSLSIIDICKHRIVSDIAITIQETDAFSAAVQEHIYAGGILIAGDWLPYRKLDENGIIYMPTTIENLSESLADCITNLEAMKLNTEFNKVKMRQLSSWDSALPSWAAVYRELVK